MTVCLSEKWPLIKSGAVILGCAAEAQMGHARPREGVRLGVCVMAELMHLLSLQLKRNALPWGRSGMAHACSGVTFEVLS